MSNTSLLPRSLAASGLALAFFCVRPLLDHADPTSKHYLKHLFTMFCFCVLAVPVVMLLGRKRKTEWPFWYVAVLTVMCISAMNLALQGVRFFSR